MCFRLNYAHARIVAARETMREERCVGSSGETADQAHGDALISSGRRKSVYSVAMSAAASAASLATIFLVFPSDEAAASAATVHRRGKAGVRRRSPESLVTHRDDTRRHGGHASSSSAIRMTSLIPRAIGPARLCQAISSVAYSNGLTHIYKHTPADRAISCE